MQLTNQKLDHLAQAKTGTEQLEVALSGVRTGAVVCVCMLALFRCFVVSDQSIVSFLEIYFCFSDSKQIRHACECEILSCEFASQSSFSVY